MEVSCKQDINHSFLVIHPEREIDTQSYPVRMVLGNAIPGLLSCRLQKADGDILLYYDITARQPLSDAYEKLTYIELKEIYQGLLKTFEQMEMYLLNADQLFLEPEYMYVDKKEGEIWLCYLPGYEKPVQEQLRCFTEYLLPRMEHQDAKGVAFGYSIYRLLAEDGFQMEAVREILHRSGRQEQKAEPCMSAEEDQAVINAGSFEKYKEPENEKAEQGGFWKNMWVKDLLLLLAGILFFGGFAGLRQMGYFTYITLPVMLAVLFCIVLGMALILWGENRKDDKETPSPEDGNPDQRGREETWRENELQEFSQREPQAELSGEETVVLYRSPEYEYPMLVCEEAGQAPPIILKREMMVIGKMDGVSDVLLDRPSISRIHAKIQKKEQGCWIADLNSKNGTFINGKKLEKGEEYLLRPEDQVIFADVGYRFVENR